MNTVSANVIWTKSESILSPNSVVGCDEDSVVDPLLIGGKGTYV